MHMHVHTNTRIAVQQSNRAEHKKMNTLNQGKSQAHVHLPRVLHAQMRHFGPNSRQRTQPLHCVGDVTAILIQQNLRRVTHKPTLTRAVKSGLEPYGSTREAEAEEAVLGFAIVKAEKRKSGLRCAEEEEDGDPKRERLPNHTNQVINHFFFGVDDVSGG
jgi:hypothetical protein